MELVLKVFTTLIASEEGTPNPGRCPPGPTEPRDCASQSLLRAEARPVIVLQALLTAALVVGLVAVLLAACWLMWRRRTHRGAHPRVATPPPAPARDSSPPPPAVS